jgi:GrpB-like predicted nucleotidyltransferase (UPF0157 family)
MAEDPIIIVNYDPAWPSEFAQLAGTIRKALGRTAIRIDHVGSTAVPGLDAKPIIDIQVSVSSLEPDAPFREPLESAGFGFSEDNPDLTKRFFREPPGTRRAHIHVRRAGSFDEQLNLLFRDYLRSHREAAEEYAATKRSLALKFGNDREGYVRAKEPTVWALLVRAHDWGQKIGWSPGPPDA